MSIERQIEQEEEILDQQLTEGLISNAEYSKAIRELHREYRAAAEDAAWEAYHNEMERW